MPILKQCCCGCTLKQGTIIIAVLNILAAISSVYGYFHAKDNDKIIQQNARAIESLYGEQTTNKITDITTTEKNIYLAMSIAYLLFLIAIVFLFIAIVNERSKFVMPFIIGKVLLIALQIITGIINIIVVASPDGGGVVAAWVIGLLLGVALEAYFFLVVYSYYQELREKE